jgi:HAD superfamily phosphoserine phosphatase-like hydrolase
MNKKKIVVFDFDGTLTTKDSFVEFIRFTKGTKVFVLGFLRYAPLLLLMKLRLYPNYKAKQKVFSYFFKGMELEEFNRHGELFAMQNSGIMRDKGLHVLKQAIRAEAETVIISASVYNWVEPCVYAKTYLCTEVEVKDGRLTGRFLTKNCYGQEKVNRLLEKYPRRDEYYLTVYGDSRGDKELLAFADEAHYKPFR